MVFRLESSTSAMLNVVMYFAFVIKVFPNFFSGWTPTSQARSEDNICHLFMNRGKKLSPSFFFIFFALSLFICMIAFPLSHISFHRIKQLQASFASLHTNMTEVGSVQSCSTFCNRTSFSQKYTYLWIWTDRITLGM